MLTNSVGVTLFIATIGNYVTASRFRISGDISLL